MNRLLSLSSVVLLLACSPATRGGRGGPEIPPEIQQARARAAADLEDAGAAAALAEAELFFDGGDPARARGAIDRALTLRPDDPALHFLSAIEHEQHGRMEQAFAAELAAVDAARSSRSPLGNAIAEVAIGYAGGRETDARDWRSRMEELVTRVVREPGQLGMPARLLAGFRLRALLSRRGDVDGADSVPDRIGCLDSVRVAGPFGPNAMLRYDQPTPAEGPGPLADRYLLDPVMGERDTRTIESDSCGFSLGGEERGPGVWVVEKQIEIAEGGAYLLHLRTPNTFRVTIDGQRLGGIDRRVEAGPSPVYYPVELAAGSHELEVVIATRHPNPFVRIALAPQVPGFAAQAGAGLPEGDGWLARYLRTRVARARGDDVGARELLSGFGGELATTARLIAISDVIANDPHKLPGDREDQSLQLLERAAQADENAWYPRFEAARNQQNARDALDAFRAVVERFDEIPSLQLDLAEAMRERDDRAAADAAVARAKELVPSCPVLTAELVALRDAGRAAEADARVEELLECDARSVARLNLFHRQRRWDDVRTEIERLTPLVTEARLRSMRIALARATGDDNTLQALREEIAQENERDFSDQFPVLEVDRTLARGNQRRAVSLIDDGIERNPDRWLRLRRTRRALTGRDELLRYRLDGAQAIADFEASGRTYEGATDVLVLDYEAIRVLEDGSSEALVHQIFRVQSEEAIERLGQLRLPGYILTIRSIKPDGRRLEPDAIAGLDHIEMPNLAIGDYVEYEYIASSGPTFNGGYRSGGWVFQSYANPFDISQIVLVAPRDMDVVIETRGPTPEPEERIDGDFRVRTWTVRESRPLTREPDAAVSPERIPGISFGFRATWDAFFDRIVDARMTMGQRDPAVDRLVAEVLRGVGPDVEQRARALHRWVLDNVDDGPADGPVAMQVLGGRGNHGAVYTHLLRVAGIDAQLALVQRLGGQSRGPLFSSDVYTGALVMIRRPNGAPLFSTVGNEHLPFGYVPSVYRNQPAVVLEPGHPTVQVGEGTTRDRFELRIDMQLAANGSAQVVVEEEHHGASAIDWRNNLEGIPPAELEGRFYEGYIARIFPQSAPRAIQIQNLDSRERPLVLRYAVEAPVVGRPGRGGVLLSPLFAFGLSRRFATLSSRETAEVVAGLERRVTLTVRGPSSLAPRTLQDTVLRGPGGETASFTSTAERNVLTVTREIAIPPRLVTPEQYEDFARFCREATDLEQGEILVPL